MDYVPLAPCFLSPFFFSKPARHDVLKKCCYFASLLWLRLIHSLCECQCLCHCNFSRVLWVVMEKSGSRWACLEQIPPAGEKSPVAVQELRTARLGPERCKSEKIVEVTPSMKTRESQGGENLLGYSLCVQHHVGPRPDAVWGVRTPLHY